MSKEERKYRDVPTSELLDFVGKNISYEDTKNKEKQQEYENELEQREPFDDIRRKLNSMSNDLKSIRKLLEDLSGHYHVDGKIVIDIKKAHDNWRFE